MDHHKIDFSSIDDSARAPADPYYEVRTFLLLMTLVLAIGTAVVMNLGLAETLHGLLQTGMGIVAVILAACCVALPLLALSEMG